MLIGFDPVVSPDLLHALAALGHGDRTCWWTPTIPPLAGAA
jgi:L-fucose mutarotase/ribose pyranase (RbsD/FucU family)